MERDTTAAAGKRSSSKGRYFPPPEFYTPEMCSRCGVCCGSTDSHPCEHLRVDAEGKYFCDIYADRLGPQKTVEGKTFLCVPIRELIEHNGGYGCCAYVKAIKRLREEMGQDTSDLGRLDMP